MKKLNDDEMRMFVAFHEVSHAMAWKEMGFAVADISLRGKGRRTDGGVTLARFEWFRDEKHVYGYLVGIQGGLVGGRRWCEGNGFVTPTSGEGHDQSLFRRISRHRLAPDVSRSTIEASARDALRQNWSRVERAALRLYERGSVEI